MCCCTHTQRHAYPHMITHVVFKSHTMCLEDNSQKVGIKFKLLGLEGRCFPLQLHLSLPETVWTRGFHSLPLLRLPEGDLLSRLSQSYTIPSCLLFVHKDTPASASQKDVFFFCIINQEIVWAPLTYDALQPATVFVLSILGKGYSTRELGGPEIHVINVSCRHSIENK